MADPVGCDCPHCRAVSTAAAIALRQTEDSFSRLTQVSKTAFMLASVLFVAREIRRLSPASRRVLIANARLIEADFAAERARLS
jgi:hypothetical protein